MSLVKSSSGFIAYHSVDLTANEKKSVNVFGRVFVCDAATAPFRMNFNDGEFFDVKGAGVQWALSADDRYARLQFFSATANTVAFYTGDFTYHENVVVPVSKVAQTKVKAGPTLIAGGGTLNLPGTGVVGYGYRKHLIIENLAATNLDLFLVGAVQTCHCILPNETKVFETSEDFVLINTGPDAAVRIMEIFYLPS